jgi:hypothetical protein
VKCLFGYVAASRRTSACEGAPRIRMLNVYS